MSLSRGAVGTIKSMDDRRIGRILRAVRQRRGLRQSDIAATIGVSQTVVSRLERGRLESVGLGALRRVASGARRVDHDHGQLAWRTGRQTARSGACRDRRSRDPDAEGAGVGGGGRSSASITLATAAPSMCSPGTPAVGSLLIIEVKATLTDLQDLLVSLSRKLRVVPDIVRKSLGWDADHVARIVVVAGTAANRSVVARHAATFDASFPARSREVNTWLRRPVGALAGVWFVSTSSLGTGMSVARTRIRRTSRARA